MMPWKTQLRQLRGMGWRLARSVDPQTLLSTEPVSRRFGMERGTPIDRYYIEAFLQSERECIRGRGLEIADSTYLRRFGGSRVTAFEILHVTPDNPRATLVGDLTAPDTLPEDWADCFVCTQTLNFIYDIHGAIHGMHRLLKPGGTALVTLSGLSQISRFDMDRWGDYWRVSSLAAHRAFSTVFGGDVDVRTCGNVLAATALLQGLAVEDLPDPTLLDTVDPDYQVIVTVRARKQSR